MGHYTKEKAISVVTLCAKAYKENLVDKSLLFVCADKHNNISCVEFTFDSSNFLHLTGLKPKPFIDSYDKEHTLNATEFYNRCTDNKLRASEFDFALDGTTSLKLDVLPSVINKSLSAKMIGDYNSVNPKLYTEKLVGNISACMGFVKANHTGRYVPNTILKVDMRNYTAGTLKVIAVFRKSVSKQEYNELTYRSNKTEWDKIHLPKEFEYLSSLIK